MSEPLFDTKAFNKQGFSSRTEAVEVPALRAWFKDLPEDEQPVWIVRNLDATELALVTEAADRQANLAGAVEAIAGSSGRDKVEAIQQLLGIAEGETPASLVKRQEMLIAGSVNPKVDSQTAAKLAENFPVELNILTNKILYLTGMGSVPGKPPPSGKTKA